VRIVSMEFRMPIPTLAREVMKPDPPRCTVHATLDEVAGLMVEHDCGAILVVDTADRPAGIITERDIVRRVVAKGKNPLAYAAATCLSRPVITVRGDVALDQVLALMTHHQIGQVVVVDGAGACAGMVSQDDISRRLSLSSPATGEKAAQ
jgi:CBS domain-containing protein